MEEQEQPTTPPVAPAPQSKDGQPLTRGAIATLECEVVDILQGEYVEVKHDGGQFMVKASQLSVS